MSALVLTEDRSDHAFDTIRTFVKHLLAIIDPATQTHHLDFEPVSDQHARAASIANRWKSTEQEDRPKLIALLRMIAGRIAEPGGFVFFHFDGDAAWVDHESCVTRADFAAVIESGVKETLRMRLAERKELTDTQINDLVDAAALRLVPVVPFYSIEAWCYQNTAKAREICERHHRGAHTKLFEEWKNNRAALDEIVKVKENECLGARYNRQLATENFPSDAVFAIGKSFAHAVFEMAARRPLVETLEMTHQWPKPPPIC